MKLNITSLLVGFIFIQQEILLAQATTAPITISGIIREPTCIINKNGPIDVDYGTMRTDEVETSKGTKTTRFPLNCNGVNLTLYLMGTGAAFNRDYLKTNMADLAIKFTDDVNVAIPINGTVPIETQYTFLDVKTVLVKKPGTTLGGGTFTATTTFVFEYN